MREKKTTSTRRSIYSFAPIPLTADGGWFIDSPSIQFSVNKTCENLDMTNEFMRFLVTRGELNEMASVKRLVTPTTNLSFDASGRIRGAETDEPIPKENQDKWNNTRLPA